MIISGFNKLTLLDYPGKMAAMLFTQGCNWNCKFCQNSDLIHYDEEGIIPEEDILDYLEKRKGMLEGLVVSGGEPTMQKDLKDFLRKVKSKGYQIKLDTNGSTPDILKEIIEEKLVDYIAMDIKNIFEEYEPIVNIKKINQASIKKSIELIKNSGIDHEFRTTIMKNYHDIEKIKKIYGYLGDNEKYYLQNFEDSDGVLDKTLVSYSKDELKFLNEELSRYYPKIKIRGI